MPPSPPPFNTTSARTPNNTYFTSDQDEEEPGLTDIQTVALACFITLLPLIIGLFSYFGIKLFNRISRRLQRMPRPNFMHILGRFRGHPEPSHFGKTLAKESAERNKSSHALLNDQLKSSESQFSVIPVEDGQAKNVTTYAPNQSKSMAVNGSIITMTMKNNHLIVETEERVPDVEVPVENAGVFVVEVEPNTSAEIPEAIVHDLPNKDDGVNTGLSQSDLSCSSHGSCYRDFTYGTQQEYMGDLDYRQLVCHVVATPNDDTYLDKQHPYVLNNDEKLQDTEIHIDETIQAVAEPEAASSEVNS